jgi:Putative beta-barrel porin-2, OmpL-like. bbp2
MSKTFLMFAFLSCAFISKAQDIDSLKVKYSGNFDFYYNYDLGKPENAIRQSYFVSYNRHNQLRLNVGTVAVELSKSKIRSKIALQTGTFARDNYANEPSQYLGAIQEANVGFALNQTKNVWLDLGVFASHIGYESAFGGDNWTVTRSLASELTPYYLSGAKVTYNEGKWTFASILCNSWSSVFGYKKGQLPSLGTQLIYRKNEETTYSWNTFIGSGVQEGFSELRIYSNLFTTWQATKKDQFIAALDLGYQKQKTPAAGFNNWFAPSLVYRRRLSKDIHIGARTELFFDEFSVVTSAVNQHAFDLFTSSFNIDYRFTENGLLRLEGRYMNSSGDYFNSPKGLVANTAFVTFAMTKKF